MKWLIPALFWLIAAPLWAGPPDRICSDPGSGPVACIRKQHFVYDTCNAIQAFAQHYALDPNFFARLIWQESRFDPNALSPAGAQGIAQFMPHTATRRGLKDSYNPAEALDQSARYLAEMAVRFGNLGLAAVGYNGGERRAKALIDGTGGLAQETVDYVRIITGVPYPNWLEDPTPSPDLRLSKTLPFDKACFDLAQNRRMSELKQFKPRQKPWGIQMAFGISKSAAREKFTKMTRSCARLVNDEKPDMVFRKSRASPKGGYYMARLGRFDRKEAMRDCASFRKSGCICKVYKN